MLTKQQIPISLSKTARNLSFSRSFLTLQLTSVQALSTLDTSLVLFPVKLPCLQKTTV